MKNTFLVLMALTGVATATDTINWIKAYQSEESITLNRGDDGVSLDIPDIIGDEYFLANVNGDKSPAVGKLEMAITFTNVNTTSTVIAFSNDGGAQCGWGVTIKDGSLYVGQMTVNSSNTTSVMTNYTANCTEIGQVVSNKAYTLTLISYGTENSDGKPGRGDDNFYFVLSDGVDQTSGYAAGFGLNGTTGLKYIELGGSNGTADSGQFGTVSSLSLYVVPEPTTATLSLLALCGLAARRRRK